MAGTFTGAHSPFLAVVVAKPRRQSMHTYKSCRSSVVGGEACKGQAKLVASDHDEPTGCIMASIDEEEDEKVQASARLALIPV